MNLTDISYIINFGVGPLVVVLMLATRVLYFWWYVADLKEENKIIRDNLTVQKQISLELTQELSNSNQLIGALKNEVQMVRQLGGRENE